MFISGADINYLSKSELMIELKIRGADVSEEVTKLRFSLRNLLHVKKGNEFVPKPFGSGADIIKYCQKVLLDCDTLLQQFSGTVGQFHKLRAKTRHVFGLISSFKPSPSETEMVDSNEKQYSTVVQLLGKIQSVEVLTTSIDYGDEGYVREEGDNFLRTVFEPKHFITPEKVREAIASAQRSPLKASGDSPKVSLTVPQRTYKRRKLFVTSSTLNRGIESMIIHQPSTSKCVI
ncbi:hypothetical protein FQR65_LT15452 [Abscondita terminalis]|nr:hypothetical protein FQR65_LT15452 [Abscondita terminalis]